MEELVPISMFVSAAAIIIVALYLKLERRKVESTEILAAIEKGVDIKFPDQNKNRLLPGLLWLFLGLAMSLAMAVAVPHDAPAGMWVWGLIPVAVGAAYLIVFRIEQKNKGSEV